MPVHNAGTRAELEVSSVVGLRPQGPLSFFRSLPRACIGFLFAVFCDVFVMVAYGSVLLVTGLGSSSSYFASLILSASATLVYFSISAIRSENTVELLAAIGISSCVNATVFYFRANENAFAAVQRRGSNVFSSIDILPPEVRTHSLRLGMLWSHAVFYPSEARCSMRAFWPGRRSCSSHSWALGTFRIVTLAGASSSSSESVRFASFRSPPVCG
jgi:hypothetical protein